MNDHVYRRVAVLIRRDTSRLKSTRESQTEGRMSTYSRRGAEFQTRVTAARHRSKCSEPNVISPRSVLAAAVVTTTAKPYGFLPEFSLLPSSSCKGEMHGSPITTGVRFGANSTIDISHLFADLFVRSANFESRVDICMNAYNVREFSLSTILIAADYSAAHNCR